MALWFKNVFKSQFHEYHSRSSLLHLFEFRCHFVALASPAQYQEIFPKSEVGNCYSLFRQLVQKVLILKICFLEGRRLALSAWQLQYRSTDCGTHRKQFTKHSKQVDETHYMRFLDSRGLWLNLYVMVDEVLEGDETAFVTRDPRVKTWSHIKEE